jgi:hypothetical protein
MVVVPVVPSLVKSPVILSVPRAGVLEIDHVTPSPTIGLPTASSITPVNCSVPNAWIDGVSGEIVAVVGTWPVDQGDVSESHVLFVRFSASPPRSAAAVVGVEPLAASFISHDATAPSPAVGAV